MCDRVRHATDMIAASCLRFGMHVHPSRPTHAEERVVKK